MEKASTDAAATAQASPASNGGSLPPQPSDLRSAIKAAYAVIQAVLVLDAAAADRPSVIVVDHPPPQESGTTSAAGDQASELHVLSPLHPTLRPPTVGVSRQQRPLGQPARDDNDPTPPQVPTLAEAAAATTRAAIAKASAATFETDPATWPHVAHLKPEELRDIELIRSKRLMLGIRTKTRRRLVRFCLSLHFTFV
ncbi:hypothetical protein BC828DRAFT_276532 [Blastocladiella britannica]|nr:hypothetical protein BC828DRAFT_276532 [Blastocladiella britannica]